MAKRTTNERLAASYLDEAVTALRRAAERMRDAANICCPIGERMPRRADAETIERYADWCVRAANRLPDGTCDECGMVDNGCECPKIAEGGRP